MKTTESASPSTTICLKAEALPAAPFCERSAARSFQYESTRLRTSRSCARYASISVWRAAAVSLRALWSMNQSTFAVGTSVASSRNDTIIHVVRW